MRECIRLLRTTAVVLGAILASSPDIRGEDPAAARSDSQPKLPVGNTK